MSENEPPFRGVRACLKINKFIKGFRGVQKPKIKSFKGAGVNVVNNL
jgi:hypothetical protein